MDLGNKIRNDIKSFREYCSTMVNELTSKLEGIGLYPINTIFFFSNFQGGSAPAIRERVPDSSPNINILLYYQKTKRFYEKHFEFQHCQIYSK